MSATTSSVKSEYSNYYAGARTSILFAAAGIVLAPVVVSSFLNNIPLTVSATSLQYGLGAGLGGLATAYALQNQISTSPLIMGATVAGAVFVPFMAGAPINSESLIVGASTIAGGYAGFYGSVQYLRTA